MTLLRKIADTLTRRAGSSPAVYAPSGIGGWTTVFATNGRATGQVNMSELERLQQNIGIVHAATNRISEDVSSLKVSVQRQRRSGRWEAEPAHPLQTLLDAPCAAFPDTATLLYVLQQHLCLAGRAALLVVDGSHGEPRELHILYPHLLDAIPDPTGFISQYRYRTLNGQTLLFSPFSSKPDASGVSVLEIRVPHPLNPYAGNSTVQAASNSIVLDEEVRAYGRFYFANNATPNLVISSKEPHPGPEQTGMMRQEWNAAYQGVTNAGKVATLWNGAEAKSMSPAFKDLAFPEITKATRQDVLAHFGVPGPVMGYSDTGALGADVFRAAKLVYQSQTLDPHRKRLERALNRLAQRWQGVRVELESPVEDDIAAIEARQLKEVESGAISRKEYRSARGYEDDGQPDIWIIAKGAQVYHGLKPEDTAEPVSGEAPQAETTEDQQPQEKAARYRQLWGAEYRLLRDATDPAAAVAEAHARWQQEGTKTAELAMKLRQAALNATQNDLVKAYEALKAESKTLAEAT